MIERAGGASAGAPAAPGSLSAWMRAARPRTLPAAVGPVLLGGGLAWNADGFMGPAFVAALACAILLQIATNLTNDYTDFMRGADTADRLGQPRSVQSGLLPLARVRAAAFAFFAASVVAGLYLVLRGGWPVLAIGVVSIVAGFAYTGGPWPFGYYGLGDLFVFLFFGLVAVTGTVYVQSLEWRADALLGGAGIGAFTTAILVVNNLRDIETDARAGKRTLAVVLGRRGARAEYSLLLLVAAVVPPLGVARGAWPPAALLALVAVIIALAPARTVWTFREPRSLNRALEETARAVGLYGVLFAVGCVL